MIKLLLKNKQLLIIFVMLLLSIFVGLSYAYFVYNTTQDSNGIAASDCFKLSFTGSNDISLVSAVPISESEGVQLTPYTFTIKNVCNKTVQYDINLEKLNGSTLDDKYLRIMLNNDDSFIYNSKEEVSSFINENTISSRNIYTGKLRKNEEKTYNLRLWLDADADIEAAEKDFNSKIVIISTLYKPVTITFNDNGGSYGPESIDVIKDKEFEMPMSSPFKNGYVLAGWSEDSNATTPTYYLGNNYSFSSDTTLYAVWTDTIYLYNRGNEYEHITGGWKYNQMEVYGRGSKESDHLYLSYFDEVGTSASEFRTGGLKIVDSKYNLHFNYEKSHIRRPNNAYSALYYHIGNGLNVLTNNTSLGEYTDDYYRVDLSYSDILSVGSYDSYDSIYEIYLTTIAYDNPRIIVYDLNGGINGPSVGAYAYEGNSVVINENIPYKEGYAFIGYSENKNASEASYLPGKTYTFTSNTRLYAIYKEGTSSSSDKLRDYIVSLTDRADANDTSEIGFTSLAYDDASNLRYVGKNPNNYIYFNCNDYNNQKASTCEIWRIIGIVDGNLKIIRDESLGTYIWNKTDLRVNNNSGLNEWTTATLNTVLNDNYYNATNTQCSILYGGDSTCDFTTNGINNNQTRSLIKESTWYTGANSVDDNEDTYIASLSYERERGNYTGKQCSTDTICNDNVTRTTSSNAKVGLITVSDYAYAVGGDNRNVCLNTSVFQYQNECKDGDWLYYPINQWTITPYGSSTHASIVHIVSDNGSVLTYLGNNTYPSTGFFFSVRPVVSLNENLNIKKDVLSDGSYMHPYQLNIN